MRTFHKKTLAVIAGGVLLSSNALAYQANSGAGSTNQNGGSANQYRLQKMQDEAVRQQRNTQKLKDIHWNRVKEYAPLQKRNMPPPNYTGQPYLR